MDDILERYPQVKLYLKKKKLKNFAALLKNTQENDQNTPIEIDNVKKALTEVDSQMKNLPPTAQVLDLMFNFLRITCLTSC